MVANMAEWSKGKPLYYPIELRVVTLEGIY
jgi:hypothetical protein